MVGTPMGYDKVYPRRSDHGMKKRKFSGEFKHSAVQLVNQ